MTVKKGLELITSNTLVPLGASVAVVVLVVGMAFHMGSERTAIKMTLDRHTMMLSERASRFERIEVLLTKLDRSIVRVEQQLYMEHHDQP